MEEKKDVFEEMFDEIPITLGDEAEEPAEESSTSKEPSPKEEAKEKEPAPSQEESPEEESEEEKEDEPQTDNSEAEDSASNKEVPFHKHPRWKRMQQELREAKEANEKLLNEVETRNTHSEPEKVPANLQKIFGEDVEAYVEFLNFTRQEQKAVLEEEFKKRDQSKNEIDKKQQELLNVYEERLADLGEELGLPLHNQNSNERNQILSICEEYGVVDAEGNPDFRKANELRVKLYPEKKKVSTERKKIASNASEAPLSGDSPVGDVMTPTRLKEARRSRDNIFSGL